MIALVFAVSLLAWALLALGLPRHYAAWFGKAPSPARRRLLRGFGWCGLPLGWALAVSLRGYELGSVLWAVLLMLAALAWALVLTARGSVSAAGVREPGAGGARPGAKARPRS